MMNLQEDIAPTQKLTAELNKLQKVVQNTQQRISLDSFINTMIRGGFSEIVETHGGQMLSFRIISPANETLTLQEFMIPNLGKNNNLLGFLLAANDGSQTVTLMPTVKVGSLFTELHNFFRGLHEVIMYALENGNKIDVQLK